MGNSHTHHNVTGILMKGNIYGCAILVPIKKDGKVVVYVGIAVQVFQQRRSIDRVPMTVILHLTVEKGSN